MRNISGFLRFVIATAVACGALQVLAATASAYEWSAGPAQAIPSGGQSGTYQLVSCPDAGDCTAVSPYNGPSVEEEIAGVWQTPTALPGFGGLSNVLLSGLDCVDDSDCVAVGSSSSESFSISEIGGVWGNPVPIATGLGTNQANVAAAMRSSGTVSCSSLSDCVVVGVEGVPNVNGGQTPYAIAADGSISGFGAVTETIPNAVFDAVGCVPGGDTCTAAGFADTSQGPQTIVASDTGGTWSPTDTLTSGSGNGYGWEGWSIACPAVESCTVSGIEPSAYYSDPAIPYTLQEEDGDWGGPDLLGPDGATYGGFVMGPISCVSAGNCMIGGENGAGTYPQAIYAQESGGAWDGFINSPVPGDLSATEPASVSDGVGCVPAAAVAPENPSCTFVGSYTNDNEVTGLYSFTDTLTGTPIEVTSVSPTIGPAGGGQTVTITGEGFGDPGDADTVTFVGSGGVQAAATNVTVQSDTEITAVTPSVGLQFGTDGTVLTNAIVGTPDNGTSAANPPEDNYTFSPWIYSVSPGEGPAAGGNTITITGSGFGASGSPDTVWFYPRAGGSPIQATNVTVQGDTTITATVPNASSLFAGGAESVATDVAVVTALGATTPIVANQSEYVFDNVWVDSVSPTEGRLAGGESITIYGEGFGSPGAADTVTFTPEEGGEPATATNVKVVSDEEMTAVTPNMSTTDNDTDTSLLTDVQVTVAGGSQSPVNPGDQYTFNPVTVTSVSPGDGPADGSNVVVIGGTGFGNAGDADTVEFVPQDGGAPLAATQVTVLSDTLLTATVPDAGAEMDAEGDDLVTDVQVTSAEDFTSPLNPPADEYRFSLLSVDDVSPGTGPATGGTPVVITGSGFGNAGSNDTVEFVPWDGAAPIPATSVTVIDSTTIDAVTPDAVLEMPLGGNLITDVQVSAGGRTSELNSPVDVFQFTPVAPAPYVSSVTPSSVDFGSIPKTFAIAGSGFTGASTVEFQLSSGGEIKLGAKSFTVSPGGAQITLTKPSFMLLRLWFTDRKLLASYTTDVRVVVGHAVSPLNAPADQVTFSFPVRADPAVSGGVTARSSPQAGAKHAGSAARARRRHGGRRHRRTRSRTGRRPR